MCNMLHNGTQANPEMILARGRQGDRTDIKANRPESDHRQSRDDVGDLVGVGARTVDKATGVFRFAFPDKYVDEEFHDVEKFPNLKILIMPELFSKIAFVLRWEAQCARVSVRTCARVYICMHMCTCVCIHMCTCVCMYM